MATRKLSDAEVSAFIQVAIDEYVGTQSLFYQSQIHPYLPAIAQHIINKMKARGIHIQTDENPNAKLAQAKSKNRL